MKAFMKKFLILVIGIVSGQLIRDQKYKKILEDSDKRINKFVEYFNIYDDWLELRDRKKTLIMYFERNNIQKIAIYGMGKTAMHFIEELQEGSIDIAYAIDKKVIDTTYPFCVNKLNSELPEVDVIVVTAVFEFSKIKEEIEKVVPYKVISLETVISECKRY